MISRDTVVSFRDVSEGESDLNLADEICGYLNMHWPQMEWKINNSVKGDLGSGCSFRSDATDFVLFVKPYRTDREYSSNYDLGLSYHSFLDEQVASIEISDLDHELEQVKWGVLLDHIDQIIEKGFEGLGDRIENLMDDLELYYKGVG